MSSLIISLVFLFIFSNAVAENNLQLLILNKSNQQPLTGTKINISNDNLKITNVSDSDGRANFILPNGSYKIQINYLIIEDTTFTIVLTEDKILKILINPNHSSNPKNVFSHEKDYRESRDLPLMPSVSTMAKTDYDLGVSDDIEISYFMVSESSSELGADYKISAGTLTSGEVNDFRKWDYWGGISEEELNDFKLNWKMQTYKRYTVQLIANDNFSIIDKSVYLLDQELKPIWTSKTDNTGKAELWNDFSTGQINTKVKYISVDSVNSLIRIENPKLFEEGINTIYLSENCNTPQNVDILFNIDATGSMGDEIQYLKTELLDIIEKVSNEDIANIRLGALFYRDKGDSYLIKKSDFNKDFDTVHSFIKENSAGGGGDFPEGVDYSLQVALNEFAWSENALARIMFLILDAPPHNDSISVKKMDILIRKAAQKGVRIIPVACSGIDKETEFLMRTIALATNGTYTFLTDDSGVGDSHIKPTTDKFDVEFLNDMFVRIIKQFTSIPKCDNNSDYYKKLDPEKIHNKGLALLSGEDIEEIISIYPNPTNGILNIKLNQIIEELYILDITGKIILQLNSLNLGSSKIDLTSFPNANYYIKFRKENAWGALGFNLIK